MRGRLSGINVSSLLAAECGSLAVTVKKSRTTHPHEGRRLFVGRIFESDKTTSEYLGTLMYRILVNEKQKWKEHGDGTLSVTIHSFTK